MYRNTSAFGRKCRDGIEQIAAPLESGIILDFDRGNSPFSVRSLVGQLHESLHAVEQPVRVGGRDLDAAAILLHGERVRFLRLPVGPAFADFRIENQLNGFPDGGFFLRRLIRLEAHRAADDANRLIERILRFRAAVHPQRLGVESERLPVDFLHADRLRHDSRPLPTRILSRFVGPNRRGAQSNAGQNCQERQRDSFACHSRVPFLKNCRDNRTCSSFMDSGHNNYHAPNFPSFSAWAIASDIR